MIEPLTHAVDSPEPPLSAKYLHELRTPLNQILGYSEMLAERAQEEGQTALLPDLQRIHTAGRDLLSLLNRGVPSSPKTFSETESLKSPASTDFHPSTPQPDGSQVGRTPEQSALSAGQAKILVVDDNMMNRDVLSRRLARQGHAVATAENGRLALDAMRAAPFDLVLLDIMMPEMDGYEALRQLKLDETLHTIPVIMISALDEPETVVRCIEMGAEDYLSKPFEPTLLKARINACLGRKHAHDREMRLHEQLQQNYKRLEDLEKLRDDLTHMIVHDLRTPLTSLIVGMQTLESVGGLDAFQNEMVGISITGGQTLLGMINDLLDVEKMESGAMELDYSTLDAAALVEAAAGQVVALAQEKDLTLVREVAPGLPPFRGDESKLRRTLVNLLGNAIKFTPDGGVLTVEARAGKDGQAMVFSVRDTGEGIPADAFERIFEKFGQVDSRKGGRTMSTGLGLTFCKLAVKAHGGHIDVESVPGEGSTFSFTIPLGPQL